MSYRGENHAARWAFEFILLVKYPDTFERNYSMKSSVQIKGAHRHLRIPVCSNGQDIIGVGSGQPSRCPRNFVICHFPPPSAACGSTAHSFDAG
jgi:hypothetical protein